MLRRAWLLVATLLLVLLSIIATALIAWPVLLLVLLVDLVWWPVAQLRRRQASPPPRDVSGASIVTVSWNGKHFLETLLPSLRRVIDEDGGDHEVIVVDNGSEDGTVEWLAEVHPWVRVVALPENRFFVRGNKAGVEAATRDVLVFLNNDMEVRPGFLTPLLEGLRDPHVFGVTAEVFFRDEHKRREETGRTRGEIRHGWLKLAHVEPSHDERELSYVPAFWAGGGSAAICAPMGSEGAPQWFTWRIGDHHSPGCAGSPRPPCEGGGPCQCSGCWHGSQKVHQKRTIGSSPILAMSASKSSPM